MCHGGRCSPQATAQSGDTHPSRRADTGWATNAQRRCPGQPGFLGSFASGRGGWGKPGAAPGPGGSSQSRRLPTSFNAPPELSGLLLPDRLPGPQAAPRPRAGAARGTPEVRGSFPGREGGGRAHTERGRLRAGGPHALLVTAGPRGVRGSCRWRLPRPGGPACSPTPRRPGPALGLASGSGGLASGLPRPATRVPGPPLRARPVANPGPSAAPPHPPRSLGRWAGWSPDSGVRACTASLRGDPLTRPPRAHKMPTRPLARLPTAVPGGARQTGRPRRCCGLGRRARGRVSGGRTASRHDTTQTGPRWTDGAAGTSARPSRPPRRCPTETFPARPWPRTTAHPEAR